MTENTRLRILIAEDHKLVSQGLETMLSMSQKLELVGVVATGEGAIESAGAEHIDVILMDVNLGGESMNGIEATRRVKETSPDTRVLILSMFTDPGTVSEAIKAGADGYLSKGASRESVIKAILDVSEGRSVLDPNVTEGIFGRIGGKESSTLTDREHSVLQQLTFGHSTREIGRQIHVSEETVKTHLKQIYRKLHARDRAEAVAEAFRRGLVR
jgi:DNA-binding NarL/FixJ family response regulator